MTDHASSDSNTPKTSPPDWDAIARFLAGESPAEEASRVNAWLAAHPTDRRLVERLNEAATAPLGDVDVDSALKSVRARMDAEPAAKRLTVVRSNGSRWRRSFVVPSLLAAAAVVFAVMVLRRATPMDHPATTTVAQVYTTAIGQRDSITLSDGSHVILGPDSRLTVAGDYGTSTRSVELRGEGYFDVRHDASKPFSVRVAHAVVEDLGTVFAVENGAGDTTTVAVLAGSVRLRAGDSSLTSGAVLSAGDRGSIAGNGRVATFPGSVTDDTAWTSGRIIFRDASLARVAGEVRRWYGVKLHFADSSLANRHVTATFNGESVDQVLKVIGLTLGARIERQGDSATVTSNRGSATAR